MGRVFYLLVLLTAAWAQEGDELPLGIVRGKLSEPESSGLRGRFLSVSYTHLTLPTT
jgi:hypothetical protein